MALGYNVHPDAYENYDDGIDYVSVPGILVPPDKLDANVQQILELLESLLKVVRPQKNMLWYYSTDSID